MAHLVLCRVNVEFTVLSNVLLGCGYLVANYTSAHILTTLVSIPSLMFIGQLFFTTQGCTPIFELLLVFLTPSRICGVS